MLVSDLEDKDKRLVLVSTLLDPEFAADCLSMDESKGDLLSAAVEELVNLAPEIRVPFAASMLRSLEHPSDSKIDI